MAKKVKKADVSDIIGLFSSNAKKSDSYLDDDGLLPNWLLTEEQKYADDKLMIKKIFKYNESICLGQIRNKRKRYESNYKLAKGFIDKSDYMMDEEFKEDYQLLDSEGPSSLELEFFPIIPNIINSLKQDLTRKYVNFHPKLVDSESINEAIFELNSAIQKSILEPWIKKFKEEHAPEEEPKSQEEAKKLEQELQAAFDQLPHVQKVYESNYKPEIVKWAEHLFERDTIKFNMNRISKDAFEDQLVVNERYIHVNHLNGDYEPEWISPDKVGYIKSPNSKCVSEGTCVFFLENLTIQGLISKYGYLMSAEDIEKFNTIMGPGYNSGGFMLDDPWQQKKRTDQVSMNNFAKIASLIDDNYLDPNTVEVAHQYFVVPRKIGKLTIKTVTRAYNTETNEEVVSTNVEIVEVNDDYKIPKGIVNTYKEKVPKTGESLIEGMHIDWYYINELWRGIRTRINSVPHGPVIDLQKEDQMQDIWLYLDKCEYQGRPENDKWETIIPVFGGPVEYKKFKFSKSLVDILAPFQKYYNYLMNKIKELVITELMPFYIMNKEMLGSNSLEESWQDDPLFKFILSGQENGVTVADLEGANPQLLTAMPQQAVINLDRSNAIKTRWELAQLFKNEGYAVVGATPQFMGDINRYETATGVQAGIQQGTLQIQHLYDAHFDMMRNVHQYMLDLAQVIHFKKGGMIELAYINSDAQNQIFKIEAKNLPLSRKIGLYMINSVRENEVLALMKQLALQDNTMGADGYEKALILTANSQAQLLDRLKKQQMKRDKQIEAQMKHDQEKQMREIEAAKEELKAKQEFEAKENQLDRQLEYITTQISALGWSENADINDNQILDVTEVAKLDAINQKIANELSLSEDKMNFEKEKQKEQLMLEKKKLEEMKRANLYDFQVKMQEIAAKRFSKQIDLKIAKENKGKYDKK